MTLSSARWRLLLPLLTIAALGGCATSSQSEKDPVYHRYDQQELPKKPQPGNGRETDFDLEPISVIVVPTVAKVQTTVDVIVVVGNSSAAGTNYVVKYNVLLDPPGTAVTAAEVSSILITAPGNIGTPAPTPAFTFQIRTGNVTRSYTVVVRVFGPGGRQAAGVFRIVP